MALNMAKFLARFVEEAREHIQTINQGLLNQEKNPDDLETLNAIFRSAHTIKGSSRMMKLTPITEVAHKLEDVLDALRGKRIPLSKALSDLLFGGIDCIAGMVEKVAAGQEIPAASEDLCQALAAAAQGEIPRGTMTPPSPPPPAATTPPATPAEDQTTPSAAPAAAPAGPPAEALPRPTSYETIRIPAEKMDALIKLTGEMISSQIRLKQRLSEMREMEMLAKRNLQLLEQGGNGDSSSPQGEAFAGVQSLYLGLKQLSSHLKDDTNLQELLTGELQGNALRMRMLPLSTIFDTLPRFVRDLSQALGKKADLVVRGAETELDKKMLEKIGDPLVHMIRNAIDHGVETPENRRGAGKPETGTIELCAGYEGGSIWIRLSDDGAGINLARIREKALRKKLLDADQLEKIPDGEIIQLIFRPGFSTSEIITDVSGRGVGMDVVRKSIIEDLKGSIQIETKEGRGTTFYIRLPLTLAIMHVLLITAAGTALAIPASAVNEILRIAEDQVIDVVDRKAIRLREQLIPVVALKDILGLPGEDGLDGKGLLILIVSMGNGRLGLIVESLVKEEDMVIKPLPPQLKNIPWVSGVVVSGKNELINVLHVPKIIESAKEVKIRERAPRKEEDQRRFHLLVVDDSINTREIEKTILESSGYRVTLAGDGAEALEKTQQEKYDLIITDVEMPRLDGFSLTEKLRAGEEYRDTPIIIVTSREKETDKRRGIQVGADAYIVKGTFDQSNLLETVQNLLG